MRSKLIALFASLFAFAFTVAVAAQTYPNRPIRLVVPFPPGSPSDTLGRILAQRLTEKLGQPVVLDNRAGAAGIVGVETGAKATPDGYTLLVGSTGALAISPALMAKIPYDPVKDLAPISLVASSPFLYTISLAVPANNFRDFVALAKSKPRQFNYGSTGIGSATHLPMEQLRVLTGMELVHVTYKGGGLALTGLLANEVQVMFTSIPVLLASVKAGRVKALAVSSATRSPLLPEVPTMIESGLLGFTVEFTVGFLAPAGTPPAIIKKLNQDIVNILAAPEIKERFIALGAQPLTSTPEQFRAHIVSELRKYSKIIKDAGIQPE